MHTSYNYYFWLIATVTAKFVSQTDESVETLTVGSFLREAHVFFSLSLSLITKLLDPNMSAVKRSSNLFQSGFGEISPLLQIFDYVAACAEASVTFKA